MIALPASPAADASSARPKAGPVRRETARNGVLALTLSACLHILLLMLLDGTPGELRPGVLPGLRLKLAAAEPVKDAAAPRDDRGPADGEARGTGPRSLESGRAAQERSPIEGLQSESERTGASLPVPDGYFRRDQVDVVATPVEQGPLVFPEDAYIWRIAGTVRARIYINERGLVDFIRIVESQPPGVFDKAAIEALQRVRYDPAYLGGRPVKSQKLIEVKFDPYEKMPDQAPRR